MTAVTLVVGVGNTLRRDEGAGVYAVRHLQQHHPDAEAEFMDAGTLSFALAHRITRASNLILVDAAYMNKAPGSVRVFEGDNMDGFLRGRRRLSAHEVSLVDLLAIARLSGLLPARRALVGIEPGDLDWGEGLTDAVRRAIPQAAAATLDLMGRWSADQASTTCAS